VKQQCGRQTDGVGKRAVLVLGKKLVDVR
jgi:hypothetical protein